VNRDALKRTIMSRTASEFADVVFVADDNPRTELPAAIRRSILAAAPGARDAGDRYSAIRDALSELGKRRHSSHYR
jgi:UDP-N-acetylmuramoyl-L-alanyl-D-glutamate--2,6-diaminopimelate ligase